MQSTPYPAHSVVLIDWERATYASGLDLVPPDGAGDVGIIDTERDEVGDYRVIVPIEGDWGPIQGVWVHEDALTPATGARQAAPRVRVVVASDATDRRGWAVASVIKGQTDPPPPADGPWHGIIVDGPTTNGDYFVELDCGALAWVAPSSLTIETEPPRWEPNVGDIVRVTGDEGDHGYDIEPGTACLVTDTEPGFGRAKVAAPIPGMDPPVRERWVDLADLAPADVTDRA